MVGDDHDATVPKLRTNAVDELRFVLVQFH